MKKKSIQTRFLSFVFAVALGLAASSGVHAQRFLDQLEGVLDAEADAAEARKATERAPGYLGFVAIEFDDRVFIETVRSDTAAERAGVKVGDVLTKVDGRAVKTLDELGEALAHRFAGDRVLLSIARGGKEVQVPATLGTRPVALVKDDDVPAEPDPFAPEAETDVGPTTPAPAPPVDALDALRTLEGLLDKEADAPPPKPKADPARAKRIAEFQSELDAIHRRISELEREIGELTPRRD